MYRKTQILLLGFALLSTSANAERIANVSPISNGELITNGSFSPLAEDNDYRFYGSFQEQHGKEDFDSQLLPNEEEDSQTGTIGGDFRVAKQAYLSFGVARTYLESRNKENDFVLGSKNRLNATQYGGKGVYQGEQFLFGVELFRVQAESKQSTDGVEFERSNSSVDIDFWASLLSFSYELNPNTRLGVDFMPEFIYEAEFSGDSEGTVTGGEANSFGFGIGFSEDRWDFEYNFVYTEEHDFLREPSDLIHTIVSAYKHGWIGGEVSYDLWSNRSARFNGEKVKRDAGSNTALGLFFELESQVIEVSWLLHETHSSDSNLNTSGFKVVYTTNL